MFTGIIEKTGVIESLELRENGSARLRLRAELGELSRGESVAVNGVCLTMLPAESGLYDADLSPETMKRTALSDLQSRSRVNLETALALGDRLGGHLVQGHVDATGELISIERQDEFAVFRWSYPERFADLVVDKGSIAVDGISLTIVDPDESSFAVAIIPETLDRTTLGHSSPGERSNLEFDIMAKHARHLFQRYLEARD
ncbi:MAG: riboflavin synthase [Thermoanaerobaculia bacterium]|nr:riboflavin synthase [Thermoanaerobaculia bacterium]